MIFTDSGQLRDHISLCCIVCNSSAFLSRQALIDHSKLCQSVDLNEKAGITSNTGVCNDASPITLLIQALSNSKVDIPQNTLKEIKVVELKQNQRKRNPEHYINRNETLLDPVTFNLEGKAV